MAQLPIANSRKDAEKNLAEMTEASRTAMPSAAATPTKVHVVMGNDYPHAVWADEAKAQAWCDAQAKDKTKRIYWRVYSFDLTT